MTKATAYALAVLVLSGCTRNPFDPNAAPVTPASSVLDLSEVLKEASFVYFLADQTSILAVVLHARDAASLIRYDPSGAHKSEFPIPDFDDAPAIRDIATDANGNIGLLKVGEKGERIEVLSPAGRVVHEYPLKGNAQKISFTLRQIFALTDDGILRVDDGKLLTALPKGKYHLLPGNNAKLAAINENLPLMYVFDFATSQRSTYVLRAPEIDHSIAWSKENAPNQPGLIIFSAAVDANGTFYGAISPYSANLKVLKFDESGQVIGRMIVRLPPAVVGGNPAVAHMDTSGGIACLGDRLLVCSRLKKKLAFYPNPLANNTDTFVP